MKAHTKEQTGRAVPHVNVTPLIDVLLVLLIIFMVITPLRPARFKASVPGGEPPPQGAVANPYTLIVTIAPDHSLSLNEREHLGAIGDTGILATRLAEVFAQREKSHAFRQNINLSALPESEWVEKTVFIKAPRSIKYGDVVKVLDDVKGAGANPIGFQIDDLEP